MSVREVIEQLPEAQVRELYRLALEHPDSTWHLNQCGCCVSLHPEGDNNKHGWVISEDGESEYLDLRS